MGSSEEAISDAQRPSAAVGTAFGGAGSSQSGACTIYAHPRTYATAAGGTWSTLGYTARYATSEKRDDTASSPETMGVFLWIPLPNVTRDASFNCVPAAGPATVPAAVAFDAGQRTVPASDAWDGYRGFNAIATPLDGCGRPGVPVLAAGEDPREDAITDFFATKAAGNMVSCRNVGAPSGAGGSSGGAGGGGAPPPPPGGPPPGGGMGMDDGADMLAELSPTANAQLRTIQSLIRDHESQELGARARAGEFDAFREEAVRYLARNGGMSRSDDEAAAMSHDMPADVRAELTDLTEMSRRGEADAIKQRLANGGFPALKRETERAREAARVGDVGSLHTEVVCAEMTTCASMAIAHTGAFAWALGSVASIIDASTTLGKTSGWANLIGAELGMISAAIPGYPACVLAAADVTCPGASQATAAVSIALMVMQWSAIVPVDIATFICQVSGKC